jgi:hypothetical protein
VTEYKPTELQLAKANFATSEHIRLVAKNLMFFAKEILDRAAEHDASKLQPPEVDGFAVVTDQLAELTYMSPAYGEKLAELRPVLDHHYANNRHHPQFHKDGVRDMNLIDLVEMFADWHAASKRHNDGNIRKSIEKNSDRFEMGQALTRIFENTADLFD